MPILGGGGMMSFGGKSSQAASTQLALSDGLACFTGSFSGVTSIAISHGLDSSDLVVEFKDQLGNLLIPDTWSITNSNVIEAEFTPAATGDVTIIACIQSGLAPITGGVTLLEGLSGIIDLDCNDGSVEISTSGQVINICAIFTPASGALLEQKCRDIDTLSGLIGTGGDTDTQTSINGLSGTLTLKGVSGIQVSEVGQSICIAAEPSGITQIIQEVGFSGLHDQVVSVNTSDQSTNNDSFVEALQLSIATSGGLYRIGWTLEGEVDSDGKTARYQVQLDDVITLMSIDPSFSEEDTPNVFSSFDYQPLTEGVHTVDLDFAVADTGVINTIRRARIEAWRVGDLNA